MQCKIQTKTNDKLGKICSTQITGKELISIIFTEEKITSPREKWAKDGPQMVHKKEKRNDSYYKKVLNPSHMRNAN